MEEQTFAAAVVGVAYFFLPAYLANMAPVLIGGAWPALARPLDGGRMLGGRRILGDHKTWRGLLAGIAVGVLVFEAQVLLHRLGLLHRLAAVDYGSALPLLPGFLLGLGAGVGDAIKSFFKRRRDIAPGASWIGFDQLDFMAGAYLLVLPLYALPLLPTLVLLPAVFAGSLVVSATGYWLGLKEAWI